MDTTNIRQRQIELLLEDPGAVSQFGSVSPPIYQTSLFSHPNFESFQRAMNDESSAYIYSRGNNPTVRVVEEKLAALEGGEDARLFSSGVSAIAAAGMSLLRQGDHVVCVEDCYSWTRYLFETYLSRFGVRTSFVEGVEIAQFEAAITSETKLIYLESPTTLTFKLQNLEAVSALAGRHGIRTIIDNTWATPLLQNPIDHGIDLVVHSTSKYLGGHSDVIGGVVVGSSEMVSHIFETEYMPIGHISTPSHAWLILRGLRTLSVRLSRHYESACLVARFLEEQPEIDQVLWPGLASHPQYELFSRQMRGASSLLSFTLIDSSVAAIRRFTDALRHFRIGVSWGGFESLVFPIAVKLQPEVNEAMGLQRLIRIHVGLDDPQLLIDDLRCALDTVA